jgi:hypothetical protein
MAPTILATSPTFHAVDGRQPVGRRQIAAQADYAGTVTVLYRAAETYWVATTRDARDAFTVDSEVGSSAAIWFDTAEGRYVIDYCDRDGRRAEASRTHGLGAAIGVATSVASHLWAQSR